MGVDVYGRPVRTQLCGIQCKGKDRLTLKKVTRIELKREVDKAKRFKPKLTSFTLATTSPRDAAIQRYARELTQLHKAHGLFSVHVCSWEDICDLLSQYDDLIAELYHGAAFSKDTKPIYEGFERIHRTLTRTSQRNDSLANLAVKLILHSHSQGVDLSTLELTGMSSTQVKDIIRVLNGKRPRASKRASQPSHPLLSLDAGNALGLLSVSPLPFSIKSLSQIFPTIAWRSHFKYFREHKLITEAFSDFYHAAPHVKKALVTKTSRHLLLEQWIEALRPFSEHPDTAILLAGHLIASDKLAEGVVVLLDASERVVSGWLETYVSVLLKLDTTKTLGRIPRAQRARYLNAVASCLTRASRYDEARRWFNRLHEYSKRQRDKWGIRQYYHNCGIMLLQTGDVEQAESFFRQAIKRSKAARDYSLLGKSLYELALSTLHRSADESLAYLEQSARVKNRRKDKAGLYSIHHGRGVICVQRGQFRDACNWFSKAAKLAQDVGDFHGRALAEYNTGRSYLDLGESQKALEQFTKAKCLATDDDLSDVLALACGGEAMLHVGHEDYVLAEASFRQLYKLQINGTEAVSASITLHDIGACLVMRQKFSDARKTLRQAADLARRAGDVQWTYQSQADLAGSYDREGNGAKAVQSLRRSAAAERRRNNFDVEARLLADLVERFAACNSSVKVVEPAVAKCVDAANQSTDPSRVKGRAFAALHLWHWKNRRYDESIKSLHQLVDCAISDGNRLLESQARDQIGVCLQELGRFKEATAAHRKALRIARRIKDVESIEASLNNLAEALRHSHRPEAAITCLGEALEIAQDRRDTESVISLTHNLGLAYEFKEEFDKAEKTFQWCRTASRTTKRKRGFDYEYVRAIHALANLAWHRSRPKTALRRYKEALEAADQLASDTRNQICLNYANALAWSGNPHAAAEVLQSAEQQFSTLPDAHLYYSQLARHYDETGSKRQARKAWQSAGASAKEANNMDAIATASGALAEASEISGNLAKADVHYQNALANESVPELRAALLVQWLGVLLQLKNETAATKAFNELTSISENCNCRDEYVDALVMFGHYYWTDGNSPEKAVQCQVAAMGACEKKDLSQYMEICTMVVWGFWSCRSQLTSRKIMNMRRRTLDWIKKQGKFLSTRNELIMMWPFDAAARVARELEEGHRMSASSIATIIEDEAGRLTR